MLNEQEPLLRVKDLKKHFPVRNSLGGKSGSVKAVDGVSFDLYEGETFCLVGESGCGKSTIGRTLLRLIEPTEGQSLLRGKDTFSMTNKEMLEIRKEMQMVFQDPFTSLNPRKRVGKSLEEPLKIHKIGSAKERTERVMSLLNRLGFQKDQYYRFPFEFSGGQRQRLGLARALTMNPKLIVCDEPVSALDVSIQSQIINLLKEIQKEFNLTYLFISHDLSVVKYIADRVGVMYLGKLVEVGTTDELFDNPKHPYTKALLSAIPKPNPQSKREKIKMTGEIPSPLNPPSGCAFRTRCPYAMDKCKEVFPADTKISSDHFVACHLYNEETAHQEVVPG